MLSQSKQIKKKINFLEKISFTLTKCRLITLSGAPGDRFDSIDHCVYFYLNFIAFFFVWWSPDPNPKLFFKQVCASLPVGPRLDTEFQLRLGENFKYSPRAHVRLSFH